MILISLLLLLCLLKEGSPKLSLRQRRNAFKATPIVNNITPEGYKLVFVNAIWRHGDRSATSAMVGDKVKEEQWTFGGGGYGELTHIGMKQHFELGKIMYDRYARNDTFLSSTFKAKEIYVHSTDRNRTIVSAMSNLNGMYSSSNAKEGRDYPHNTRWPQFFVPISIHNEHGGNYIGNPQSKCPRRYDLWALARKTKDYKKAVEHKDTQYILKYLREKCDDYWLSISFETIFKIADTLHCEKTHFPHNFSTWYPWYTTEIQKKVDRINNWQIDINEGRIDDKMVDGIDIFFEIQLIRGGPLINEIIAKANGVVGCYRKKELGENTECSKKDHFYQNLKYHVISGHDFTISAYLTILGAKAKFEPDGGYPLYAAAVVTELFIDQKNQTVFRLIYRDGPNSQFRVITQFVDGCDGEFCSYEMLQKIAEKFKPEGGIENLCRKRIP